METRQKGHKSQIKPGKLILAGNSLGNSSDIPIRSLQTLGTADLVIFESMRSARKLLKNTGIIRDYLVFSEHQESESLFACRDSLYSGLTVCYMSDQGMPNLADPGKELVQIAIKLGAVISIVPGPSSITSAISACPFSCDRFYYLGFLPKKPQDKIAELKKFSNFSDPIIILDTPYRLNQTISCLASIFGDKKTCLLALDISSEKEQFLYGDIKKIRDLAKTLLDHLNFVIVLEGNFRKIKNL